MIHVKVTHDELVTHKACESGLDDFDAAYPDGVMEMDWTQENQIALITGPLKRWVGWAVWRNILPNVNLRWANLIGANLTEANLIGANLTGANLTGADLTGAYLTNAIGYTPDA